MQVSERINRASEDEAREMLTRCCGASRWVSGMLERRPFESDEALYLGADAVWSAMTRHDVLEALAHHPRIGADINELRRRYESTADWASSEQSGAKAASEETLSSLRDGNLRYEARFGHLFVVCATGKTAAEMLTLLHERLSNDPEVELAIAAREQAKITRIRLEKLAT